MAGWFNCRRDLDGLYLVCSTTRDRFTAQELIFETLTLCVRGRVLSILLCISAWHRKERILGPTRAACRLEVAVWNYVYFKLGSAHGRFDFHCFPERLPRPRTDAPRESSGIEFRHQWNAEFMHFTRFSSPYCVTDWAIFNNAAEHSCLAPKLIC